jgi:hypothetical protein
MTEAEMRKTVLDTLGDIAPEADLAALAQAGTLAKGSTSTPWTF